MEKGRKKKREKERTRDTYKDIKRGKKEIER